MSGLSPTELDAIEARHSGCTRFMCLTCSLIELVRLERETSAALQVANERWQEAWVWATAVHEETCDAIEKIEECRDDLTGGWGVRLRVAIEEAVEVARRGR